MLWQCPLTLLFLLSAQLSNPPRQKNIYFSSRCQYAGSLELAIFYPGVSLANSFLPLAAFLFAHLQLECVVGIKVVKNSLSSEISEIRLHVKDTASLETSPSSLHRPET